MSGAKIITGLREAIDLEQQVNRLALELSTVPVGIDGEALACWLNVHELKCVARAALLHIRREAQNGETLERQEVQPHQAPKAGTAEGGGCCADTTDHQEEE